MKLRNIPGIQWPPSWGGFYGKGDNFAIGDQEGTFKAALLRGKDVEIQIEFQGRDQMGVIALEDEKLLQRISDALNQHRGKPLKGIGDVEVPEK